MAYIWINPVTDRMYEPAVLNEFLSRHGYTRFYTSTDWLTVVKEKYRLAVEAATDTVMDVRCPKTKDVLDDLGIQSAVSFPEIEPILIHCGQECSQREDLSDEEKIITTPCQALADMGNALGLKNTWFVTWKSFVASIGERPEGILPKSSPIPPGFFKGLGFQTVSLTGEEEIRQYFTNYKANEVQLVEMLYCKEGCHNGDGMML